MLSLERVREAVTKACESFDCVYALLFGSRATGSAKEYSDVDIAVKFRDAGNCLAKASEIASIIEEELGVRVDVVPLNVADTILKYEAYSYGIPLYCVDRNAYVDDYVNAIDEYLDFERTFSKFYEKTVEEIRSAHARRQSEDR